MPPKKGKGSKKSGKKGKGKDKDVPLEAVMIDEPELNKDFFILHIKDLERKLRLYKEKESKLQSENNTYLKKEKEMSQEKYDLITFLKKNLMNRGDELMDLKMRYNGLLQTKESDKNRYDLLLQDIRTNLLDTKDRLTTKNNIISAKLEALEKFKQDKDRCLEEYAELEKVMEDKKNEHQQVLALINDKQSQDRDRLKKEIVSKINLVAADFRKISQKQTSETTKRTIRENVSIRTQLAKMEDKNIEFMQENQQMRLKITENIKRIKALDKSHTDLASKNSSQTKLLHLLTLKQKEHQDILEQYQREMNMILHLHEENSNFSSEIENRKKDLINLDESNEILKHAITSVKNEIEMINDSTQEARLALIKGVQHLKELLQPKNIGTATTSSKSVMSTFSKKSVTSTPGPIDLNELREWGDMEHRALAQEKLQKLLDALDYEDGSSRASSEASIVIKRKQRQLSCKSHQPSPSISISLRSASAKRGATPSTIFDVDGKSFKVLSEFEIKRQARTYSAQQRKGFCVPGSLQTVPHMSKHISTNIEKTRQLNKRLNGLDTFTTEDDIDKQPRVIASGALSDARTRFLADKLSG